MKGERKLRLVSPPVDGGLPDEPPMRADEVEDGAVTRAALDEGSETLAQALRAAYSPAEIAEVDLDAIVERALGDETQATTHERSEAERLRQELAGETSGKRSALFVALKNAHSPKALAADRQEALIMSALGFPQPRPRGVGALSPATVLAMTGIAALAAGIVLVLRPPGPSATPSADATVSKSQELPALARSADELFEASVPFPRAGEESMRVDRIASSRAADLRRNRFLAWGVQ